MRQTFTARNLAVSCVGMFGSGFGLLQILNYIGTLWGPSFRLITPLDRIEEPASGTSRRSRLFKIVTATLIASMALSGCVQKREVSRTWHAKFRHPQLGTCHTYRIETEYKTPYESIYNDRKETAITYETVCDGIVASCGATPDCSLALRRAIRARQSRDGDDGGGGGGGGAASEPHG